MDKKSLREKLISKREALSSKQVKDKSAKIAEQLFSMKEIKEAKIVAVYISFRNEVETRVIIAKLWSLGKKVVVPSSNHSKKTFSYAILESFNNLVEDSFGVLEPVEKKFVNPDSIDVFLVPGVAFDSKGFRLGWGKGFYDKFFGAQKFKGKIIGLAFDFQLVEKIPHDSFDVPMDLVASEEKILEF